MRKIKILRIIARLNIGGPAIHTVLLTKELNDDNFESRLLCGSISEAEGDMGYLARDYGIKPVYVPELKRGISLFRDLVSFYKIFRYIQRYRPDIVHTHTAKAGTLGRIAAILANVPVKIHTFHGNVFHGYFNKRSTRIFIFIERILAKFTDVIITISQRQKEDIVKRYRITSSHKCRVIRLGFDLNSFIGSEHKRNSFRRKFDFKDDDLLVGMVGRLTPIKNHKMFFDVAEHVHKNAGASLKERLKFVVVGDGKLRHELELYRKFKRLEKNIFFTGWIKEIDEVYADLDIVTLTSINEGTPVSLIEAMASSKPVVSTDVGGLRDTVGNIGILVESGDYKTMGEKILDLAASLDKRKELGRYGMDFVKSAYSKERLVSELKELYKNLLRTKGGLA